jgi:flagellar basal body-associated protein FliL
MKTSLKIAIPIILVIVCVLVFGYFFFAGQEKSAKEMVLDQNLPGENKPKAVEPKEMVIPSATGNIDDIINSTLLFSDNEKSLAVKNDQAALSTANDNQAINNYLKIYNESEY